MTGPAAHLSSPATMPVRALFWNACFAGVLMVAVGTFFIAEVTTTGAALGPVSMILAGVVIVGAWLVGLAVAPKGWRVIVIGMWVVAGLMVIRSIGWLSAAGISAYGPMGGAGLLLACVAAPALGVLVLSWALQARVQPPATTADFQRLWKQWVRLNWLLSLALVVVVATGLLIGLSR